MRRKCCMKNIPPNVYSTRLICQGEMKWPADLLSLIVWHFSISKANSKDIRIILRNDQHTGAAKKKLRDDLLFEKLALHVESSTRLLA